MKKYFFLPVLLLLGILAGCNKVDVDSDYVSVDGVTLDQESAYLVIGTTMTLKATVLPAKASKKEVEWKSSNPSVASVEDGLVTAHALGTADITVTSVSGGYEASCAITVVEKPIPVTGVTLSPADVTIKKGSTATLSAKLQPSNATNHNLKWTSSNESAVSVKDGVVTGVDYGTSTITVETVDGGFKATAKVKVVKPISAISVTTPNLKTLGIASAPVGLDKGSTYTVVFSASPADADDEVEMVAATGLSVKSSTATNVVVSGTAYATKTTLVIRSKVDPSVSKTVYFNVYEIPSGISLVGPNGTDATPIRSHFIGQGKSQTFSYTIEPAGKVNPDVKLSIQSVSGQKTIDFTLKGNTLVATGSKTGTASSKGANKTTTVSLKAGSYTASFDFHLSKYDPFAWKIGDLVWRQTGTGRTVIQCQDSGYRGNGIYESSVSDPIPSGSNTYEIGIIAATVSGTMASRDGTYSKHNGVDPDMPCHGILIPYLTDMVYRTNLVKGVNMSWDDWDIPKETDGEKFCNSSYGLFAQSDKPSVAGFDQSKLRISTVNADECCAYNNTLGLVYYTLNMQDDDKKIRPSMYVMSETLYKVLGSPTGKASDRFKTLYQYYLGYSSSVTGTLNCSRCLIPGAGTCFSPWLIPSQGDIKLIFQDDTAEKLALFKKSVQFFSGKTVNYTSKYWLSQEYSDSEAMTFEVSSSGVTFSFDSKKNKHQTLPIIYF